MKLYCEKCEKAFPFAAPESGNEVTCPDCGSKILYPEVPAAPGVVIGDFRIIRHLSKGGMGDVFLAHQISLDRPAALKVLQAKFTDDKEYVEGLIREARSAAKLNHPNIVQAYAVGKEDGVFYFAMEFVQGKTFKEILKEKKVLDFVQAAQVIRQVADALDFAWKEQKLVHQDIKPDNIMLDSIGRAKLADLGLARNANAEFDADAEEVLGTPQYISPEQLTGVPTDVRSDIYSLGATFYQFVTGRFPYVSDSVEELAKMHVAGNLEPPKQVNPDLPEELNTIIMKMMARKLDERYQSPGILIQALDLFLNSRKKTGGVPTLSLKGKQDPVKPKLSLKLPQKAVSAPTAAKPVVKATPPSAPAAKPVVKATPPSAPAAKPVLKASPPQAPVAKPVLKASPPQAPVAKPVLKASPPSALAPEKKQEEQEKKTTDTASAQTEPAEEKETKEEKKKHFSFAFLKKPAVKWSVIAVAGVLLLTAGSACGLYFLQRSEKLPGFLKPAGTWICRLVDSGKTAVQPAQKTTQTAQTKPVPPPPPPRPKRMPKPMPPPPPPPPKTRPEYMRAIRDLLDWNRTHPTEGKVFLKQVAENWHRLSKPHTREEKQALKRLGEICSSLDETLYFAPDREKARAAHRAEIEKRRLAIEKAKEKKRLAEEATQKRVAELAQADIENQARRQELQQKEKERLAEVMQKLNSMQKEFAEGFFAWAYQNDQARYQAAKAQLDEWRLAVDCTPAEKNLDKKIRNFARSIPKAVADLEKFRESLQRFSEKDHLQLWLIKGRSAWILTSIKAGEVRARDPKKRKDKPLDLHNPHVRRCIMRAMKKIPDFGFYFDILSREYRDDKFHKIPKGFWKDNWEVLKPYLEERH